jgi:uncharacterized damage-inducible protein DinB
MTTGNPELAKLFLEVSRKKLLETYWPQLHDCVCTLSEEQVWWRPNDASNSIGNLLLHLNGNVGQWLLASFNKSEDCRNRPLEFAERGPTPVAGLLARLASTLEEACTVLCRLTPEELAASYAIRGESVTGMEAIYHCISHFTLHYGQIAYIVKTLQNRDLGFYREPSKTGSYA